MATKTFEELKQMAIQIRDEKANKHNTATRIGTQMIEHLTKLEQDYYDKGIIDEQNKENDRKLSELCNRTTAIFLSNQYVNKINPKVNWIEGIFINPSGKVQTNDNYATSVYISVVGFEKIYSNIYAFGNMAGYDSGLKFVKYIDLNSGGFSGAYLIDSGISYIRLTLTRKISVKSVFLYTDDNFVNKGNVSLSVYIDYGITYTDLAYRKELDIVPTKLNDFHSMYVNSINQFTKSLIEAEGAFINTSDGITIVKNTATAHQSYSKFIPVVGGKFLSTNIQAYGSVLTYDNNKIFLGALSGFAYDIRFKNSMGYLTLSEDVAFIRFNVPIKHYDILCLALGDDIIFHNNYKYGEIFDLHFKFRGKKLVTIGDSITYQRTWQDRLCELTGMWHNPKEIRGADEKVKTEGYGYILLTPELEDTDTYYEEVAGIIKTDETVLDGFGYAHPIWKDSEGNKYRQPCRTAEGGETVMPVRATSIYSRASDSKYYKGDVIIVFGGANDKVTYITKYPTIGDVSTIKGLTNIKDDKEDITNSDFEIYTENKVLTSVGDYSNDGETTGIQKYNYSFRACFRGLLKRIVDANPNAKIIVLGPFSTMNPRFDYIERIYDYYTQKENEVIAECAREFSCQYIDLFPLFGRYKADRFFKKEEVFIHPLPEGGIQIAEYIAALI